MDAGRQHAGLCPLQSSGYKAFAFNAGFVGFNPEAATEYVNDVEIGYKHTLGNTATIDIDAYHYGYFNDQVPIGVPAGSVTLTEFVNVPRAVSEGVEMEAYWRPIRHLDLTLTYGFDYTNIQSTCANVGGVAVGYCYVDALDPASPRSRTRGRLATRICGQAFFPGGPTAPSCPMRPQNEDRPSTWALYLAVPTQETPDLPRRPISGRRSRSARSSSGSMTRRRPGVRSTCA